LLEQRYHDVPYEVANPEWERLDDLVALADGRACILRGALDAPLRSAKSALIGEKGDAIRDQLARLRSKVVSAADDTVEAIREKRDAQDRMLAKTRVESYQVWVPDQAVW